MQARIAVVVLALGLAQRASAAPREFTATHTETLTAKVKQVDQKTRTVVVVVPADGTERTFEAGPDVRNLAQLKVGDVVTAKTDQVLTVRILGADEAAPALASDTEVTRAAPGQKPGGTMTTEQTGSGTVEAIAKDRSTVTFKGPRGNAVTVLVKDPASLEGVTVGTRVGVSYRETRAISVTPGKAEKKKPAAKK